jgi:2-aminoadipate transaminase
MLESDGLIKGHVGRGSFVDHADSSSGGMLTVISFTSSRPADDQFPLEDFRITCQEVASGANAAGILQLGSPLGYPALRRYLLEQARMEGSAGPDDDILITSGCQQGMDLLQRVLAGSAEAVVMEDPVYHGVKNVFSRAGARIFAVPVRQRGLEVEVFERALQQHRPKLAILTPNFQNPTGTTLGKESRRAVLRAAERFGVVLVENDLYGCLRYEGDPVRAIKQMNPGAGTVLLRSFSKVAFPGLRVGWMIGPRKLIAELAETRQWCDLHSDQLSQAIFLRFAESGRLAAHIERVCRAGRERLHSAVSACDRHLPAGSQFTRPEGGMNLWVELPGRLNTSELVDKAQRAGVSYLPGSYFAVSAPQAASLRISFGALRPEAIRRGIAILGKIFGEELGRGRLLPDFEAATAIV